MNETRLCNKLIQHTNIRKMLTSSDTCLLSVKKVEKKVKKTVSYKTENTSRIKHIYTTRIQHEMYTTWRIQHEVGLSGTGLNSLHRSPG